MLDSKIILEDKICGFINNVKYKIHSMKDENKIRTLCYMECLEETPKVNETIYLEKLKDDDVTWFSLNIKRTGPVFDRDYDFFVCFDSEEKLQQIVDLLELEIDEDFYKEKLKEHEKIVADYKEILDMYTNNKKVDSKIGD